MSDQAAGLNIAFARQWQDETDPEQLDKQFLGLDTAEIISERAQLDMQFTALFETPTGRMVLEDLKARMLYRQGFNADLGLLNGIAAGFEREGQAHFLQYIISCINRGAEMRRKIAQEKAGA